MVPQTYDAAMKRVLADEGGYSNDAADPGGPTKYGITIFDVRKYLKPGATAADVRALTVPEAMDIYKKHYARPCRYDDLPAGLDYTILDYGINSGIGRSGKVLRRLVNLPDNTSAMTDEVLAAVAKRDPKALITAVNAERLRFLHNLRTWPVFGKGWGRRVGGVDHESLHMAGAISAPAPKPDPAFTPSAKGKVPEPKVVKNVVKGVGPATVAEEATRSGASWFDWIMAHQVLSVACVVAAVLVVWYVVHRINAWHAHVSEAPMPGTVPVPEIAVIPSPQVAGSVGGAV